MRIIISALLLSLCLCACAPESSPSSAPSSEPEVTSGLEVQFDDPEEAPEITADLSGTALPWEMRPEHWNGAIMCGTDLATGLIEKRYDEIPAAAAGSTITDEVPADALAVARARQKNLEGWAARRRKIHESQEQKPER